jgi:hypothetical protein
VNFNFTCLKIAVTYSSLKMEYLLEESLELSIFKITFQYALHLRTIRELPKQGMGNYNASYISMKILWRKKL